MVQVLLIPSHWEVHIMQAVPLVVMLKLRSWLRCISLTQPLQNSPKKFYLKKKVPYYEGAQTAESESPPPVCLRDSPGEALDYQ